MGLTVSLDMGSEKMVMAVAGESGGAPKLAAIKMIASAGMEEGVVTDKAKVRSYLDFLLKEGAKGEPVEVAHVALSGKSLRVTERKVTVPVQRKIVKESDLARADKRCRETAEAGENPVLDCFPAAYSLDGGSPTRRPLDRSAKELTVTYRVYTASGNSRQELEKMLLDLGVGQVRFFPAVRAFMEGVGVRNRKERFALVDLGASHTGVLLFADSLLEKEAILPLGTETVDTDICAAFKIEELRQARKLKQDEGSALRSACRNEKVEIPGLRKQIEKRDLAKVIQCRMEELLEGAIFQLQQAGFTDPEAEILLTGGGSRLADTLLLAEKLSGQRCRYAKARGVQAADDVLSAPSCLIALGLLLCKPYEPFEEQTGWFGRLFR
ncbi:MAG: cell division protein FtsA [Culturomica sp.]|jgi:cell division protein FtsA|nr:cell division protein FtsA [Culturomica sp.]